MSDSREENALIGKLSKAMKLKLEANRDRDHWRNEDSDYLLEQARNKLKLLEKACDAGQKMVAMGFAADVANFCAMAVDVTTEESEE